MLAFLTRVYENDLKAQSNLLRRFMSVDRQFTARGYVQVSAESH